MGESLYQKFLDEQVENLNEAVLHYGICGLLGEFEQWLERNGYIVEET